MGNAANHATESCSSGSTVSTGAEERLRQIDAETARLDARRRRLTAERRRVVDRIRDRKRREAARNV